MSLKKFSSYFFNSSLSLLIKNSSRLFIADIFVQGISFVQALIVARLLGVSDFGLLALITVYVVIINQVVDFRIRETVVKYVSEFLVKNDKQRLWATIRLCYFIDISTGVLAFLLVISTAGLAANYLFHRPDTQGLISFYAIILLFSTVDGTCLGILTVFDKFLSLSIYSMISTLVKFILVISFLSYSRSIHSVLTAYIIGSFLSSLILIYISIKTIRNSFWHKGIKGGLSLLSGRKAEITKFLLNTNINELLTLFTKNIDVLILGYFRMPLEVGYYRLAKNFVEAITLVSAPVSTAIYPQISKLWSSNKIKELKILIKRATILLAGITLPIAVLLFFFSGVIIQYFLGVSYLPAAQSIRIMLWGLLVAVILLWVRPFYLSIGRPGVLSLINVFNAFTMFIFSLIIVPKFGFIGSSIMYVYPYLVGHVLALFFLYRLINKALKSEV
ncbi:MAG: oligosaccharide flippase family protein [Candidatus Omnitrophica bacterium]|nr:oligosaccharide flippase family protein [Candidatus Omnitrophota bacterium]